MTASDGVERKPGKRGRPPLPRQRIVEAALALIDRDGAEALSMRSLANELGSGTATLYRHVAHRADIIALVVDAVFADAGLTTGPLPGEREGGWSERLRRLGHAMFEVLRRHPGVTRLLVEALPAGPHAMRLRETCIELLLLEGFAPGVAGTIFASLSRYVLGSALQAASASRGDQAALASLDEERFPATAAVARAGNWPVSAETEFAFGLDLMIAGIAGQRHSDASPHS